MSPMAPTSLTDLSANVSSASLPWHEPAGMATWTMDNTMNRAEGLVPMEALPYTSQAAYPTI
jgi:hypothetical protein